MQISAESDGVVERAVALAGCVVALVGDSIPAICVVVALISQQLSIVDVGGLAQVGQPFTLVGVLLPLARAAHRAWPARSRSSAERARWKAPSARPATSAQSAWRAGPGRGIGRHCTASPRSDEA